MASSSTGSSGAPVSRPDIIAEINTTIKISLTDLPKEESDDLKMKVVRLMTRLNEMSKTLEEKAEFATLRGRVLEWSQAPAAASTTAAAAGVLRAGASAALAPKFASVDPVVANETYQRIVARLGPKGIFMPYIMYQISLARGEEPDESGITLLSDALLIYEVNPEEASAQFAAFFDYMITSIREKGETPESGFYFGLQASHAGRLDLLFKPVDELAPEIIDAMRPSEAKAASAGEEVFDEAYLRKCFEEGTEAAYYLGVVGHSLSQVFLGILPLSKT